MNTDENGNLSYTTEKGFLGIKKAKVARDSNGKKIGSRSARKALKSAIKDKETINVFDSDGSGNRVTPGTNNLYFDIGQINDLMDKASSDLDPTTMGPALIFLHEAGHTLVGGSRSDGRKSKRDVRPGPNPKRINRMRRQLGISFGIRAAYDPTSVGTDSYMPFSKKTLKRIKKGKVPNEKYLKF